jgi:hypothetical protein
MVRADHPKASDDIGRRQLWERDLHQVVPAGESVEADEARFTALVIDRAAEPY